MKDTELNNLDMVFQQTANLTSHLWCAVKKVTTAALKVPISFKRENSVGNTDNSFQLWLPNIWVSVYIIKVQSAQMENHVL